MNISPSAIPDDPRRLRPGGQDQGRHALRLDGEAAAAEGDLVEPGIVGRERRPGRQDMFAIGGAQPERPGGSDARKPYLPAGGIAAQVEAGIARLAGVGIVDPVARRERLAEPVSGVGVDAGEAASASAGA